MKKVLIICFAIIAIAVSATAKADVIANIFTKDQKDAYMQLAEASEWALIGSAEFDKTKAPYSGGFTLTNTLDKYRPDDQKVGDRQGTYTMDDFSGKGAGYTNALTGIDNYVGMIFSHNSSNSTAVDLSEGLIDSFYVNVDTHANKNSTQGTFNITLNTTDGTQVFENVEYGWVGFILEEGVYLTSFEIKQNANPNTGFFFDFVPGNGTAATPEPASMLIFAAGLAGLGFARSRKQAKKAKR